MTNKELKIEQYQALQPIKYSIVEHFRVDQEVSRENDLYQLSLVLTLRSTSDFEVSRLILHFSKVRELHLSLGISALQFSFLNIVPVDGQWEDVNYKVFESAQDVDFSFFCDDFTAAVTESS